jgi:glutamate--cysteine ligase
MRRDKAAVSMEPGGQLEYSSSPRHTLREVQEDLDAFCSELREVSAGLDIAWIAVGLNPVSSWQDIELVPKKRYDVMTAYLEQKGKFALDMMRRTQSVHVTLDYHGERECAEMAQAANLAAPVVAGLFAHSPIGQGKATGYRSYRTEIWRNTDADRCGLSRAAIEGNWSFLSYLDTLLETPLIFVVRDGAFVAADGLTARQYFTDGFGGRPPEIADLEWIINQTFPDVRVRQYIECRGQDMPPLPLALAVPALWTGLLYHPSARQGVIDLLGELSFEQILELQHVMAREGLAGRDAKGRSGTDLALRVAELAQAGLAARGKSEEGLLDPLLELARQGLTPADLLLNAWEGPLAGDTVALLKKLQAA